MTERSRVRDGSSSPLWHARPSASAGSESVEPRYSITAYAAVAVVAGSIAGAMGVTLTPIIAGAWIFVVSGLLDANYAHWKRTRSRLSSRPRLITTHVRNGSEAV